MNDLITVQIPFEGCYETLTASLMDSAADSLGDYEGNGEYAPFGLSDDEAKNLYDSIDFKKAYKELASLYVVAFKEYLESELDLTLESLTFQEMTSPAAYNFETDCVYCTLTLADALKLQAKVGYDSLNHAIVECHTSYSGFASFCSNDIDSETWQQSCTEWKAYQFNTLFLALLYQAWPDKENNLVSHLAHELIMGEYLGDSNGDISNALDAAISTEGQALLSRCSALHAEHEKQLDLCL